MIGEFSFFEGGIKVSVPTRKINIEEYVELVKSNRYKIICEDIRNVHHEDKKVLKELRNAIKANLDYCTFAGCFDYRSKEKVRSMSGYMCLDLDYYDKLDELIPLLRNDKYVKVLNISPSGQGIKIVFKIRPDIDNYEKYVEKGYEYLKIKYDIPSLVLDTKTKDYSRACYMSYDPNIFYNPGSEIFDIELEKCEDDPAPVKQIDLSRSGQEWGELIRRIKNQAKKGYDKIDKEEIFNVMNKFAKWANATATYKEHQWKGALEVATKEVEEWKNKRQSDEESIIEVNSIVGDDFIAELIFDGMKTKFAVYHKGQITFKDKIEYNDVKYIPYNADTNEEIRKEAIILPDGVEEYGTVEELDEQIDKFIRAYLEVEEDMYFYLKSYVRFSWVYDKFRTLNYLKFQGDTGAGKSRALDSIGCLCYKTIFTSGATTTAPIFRTINKWKGTVIIDEADMPKGSDETNAMVKIINQGFEKNRHVMRCDDNDKEKVKFFDVYCPKIIGSRKSFDDKAVEARCITTIMQQMVRQDIPVILPKKFYEEAKVLRRKLLCYRLNNFFKIDPDKGLKCDLSYIEPRLRQVNMNFVGLFAQDEKQLEVFKGFLTKLNEKLIIERADSYDGMVIQALLDCILIQASSIAPEPITTSMVSERMIESYDCLAKFADFRVIGKHLKSFGITNKPIKVDGKTIRVLIYDLSTLINNIARRYVSDGELLEKLQGLQEKQEIRRAEFFVKKASYIENGKKGGLSVSDVSDVTNVTEERVF